MPISPDTLAFNASADKDNLPFFSFGNKLDVFFTINAFSEKFFQSWFFSNKSISFFFWYDTISE